jgi:integrase
MPKPRASKLESPTSRLRLVIRRKPYWVTISPGIALGYRRNARGAGTWSARCFNRGLEWIKRIALANDLEPADGTAVLTYWEAIDKARALVRDATGRGSARPLTVTAALDRYALDLKARGGNPYNAEHVRVHLTPALADQFVGALTADLLRRWRDQLLRQGMTAATFNRMRKGLRAALNLVSEGDDRIANARAWKIGLKDLPDAHAARNVILTDAEVARLVRCAHAIDRRLGLFVEVLAVTGARPSQAARMVVMNLNLKANRLELPTSKKGRKTKVIRRYPVPIPPALAQALALEAAGRSAEAALLLAPEGRPWRDHRKRDLFRQVATAAGLDPDLVTAYALRHSSVVRMIKAKVPIRVVASHHDTSVMMIERSYSVHITDHSDDLIRNTLPDVSPPPARNVTPLPVGRRS